jgi:hypothetical protein
MSNSCLLSRFWFTFVCLVGLLASCTQGDEDIIDLDKFDHKEEEIFDDNVNYAKLKSNTFEEMFTMEELIFLTDEQFYRKGKGESNLILQLHTDTDTSNQKENHILEAHPQCVFGRVVPDSYDFITDTVDMETTIDALYAQLKREKETKQAATLIIVDHQNGKPCHSMVL